jgi:hypothetical protein
MNDQDELGLRIAKLLDGSTDSLSAEQRDRLSAARRLALARHRPERATATAWVPAWASPISGLTEKRVFGIQYLIPMAALVLGLAGVAYMHTGTSSDIADIDAGLLTDELPINAYLDQDFASWLKRSPR